MTSDYYSMTGNILNRVSYGMPSFGYHRNYFVDESDSRKTCLALADQVLDRIPEKPGADEQFLEDMLKGLDGDERRETIYRMIEERIELKNKAKNMFENCKDNFRDMKYMGTYQLDLGMPAKDITRLYNELKRLSTEEEIKAWKDISFLKVKLWEEGIGGGYHHDPGQA